MKDKLTLLFASLALITYIYLGPSVPKIQKGIDPKIQPYVTKFEQEGKKQLGNCYKIPSINIGVGDARFVDPFSNGELRVIGLCNYLTGDMLIDPYLFSLNLTAVEEVVFHELGHCVLKRLHIEEMITKDVPLSLMYPIMVSEEVYMGYRGYYMMELFSHISLCK